MKIEARGPVIIQNASFEVCALSALREVKQQWMNAAYDHPDTSLSYSGDPYEERLCFMQLGSISLASRPRFRDLTEDELRVVDAFSLLEKTVLNVINAKKEEKPLSDYLSEKERENRLK